MAKPFVRVDLSDAARDFQPVAIEPGLALLDKANANSRLWFKWLGRLAAEAEWDGESVKFFVQDDHGGRLEEVVVQPVSEEDLRGPLKEEVALLAERLAKARADSPSERLVLGKLREDFAALVDDPSRLDRDCFFFRYRDPQRRWRLVWCVGYQRREAAAAAAVICTDPDCNLLFVRRPGGSARCPGCRAMPLVAPVSRSRAWRAAVVLLLLLGIVAALLLWRRPEPQVAVQPPERPGTAAFSKDSAEKPEVPQAEPSKKPAAPSPEAVEKPAAQGSSSQSVEQPASPASSAQPIENPAAQTSQRQSVDQPAIESRREPAGEPKESAQASGRAASPTVEHAKPSEVAILSDQGPLVRFPVGAEFDDFRVEARYADGFTRIVNKSATLRTTEEAASAPVSFSGGKMRGVHPGKTTVQAEFGGVTSKQGLEVEVTESADVQEIRLVPSPVALRPGESLRLAAFGYREGKSLGSISDLASLTWKSSDESVVGIAGPVATAKRLGQANITAQLGSVTSRPAEITVAEGRAAALRVEPTALRIRVGESVPVGDGLRVLRGELDVSRQAAVESLSPAVRYDPERHSLIGTSPGRCVVRFAYGDQAASALVEVAAASYGEGQVSIEPASAVFSVGQAIPLRVFLTEPGGRRVDRTSAATFRSSAPEKVQLLGDSACALAPGEAEITAFLPESKTPGRARIRVDNHPITDLVLEPSQIAVAVGDRARLWVLGQSVSGLRELFPQDRLVMRATGASPNAIRIVGSEHVEGVRPGDAIVEVIWSGKLRREAAVVVTEGIWSDLAIDPSAATLHPRQQLVYSVTGVRGGRRRKIGPNDGLKLSVADPKVAEVVAEGVVQGLEVGQTRVVAEVGATRAESVLNVVAGSGSSGLVVTTPGVGLPVTEPDGTAYIVGPEGQVEPPWSEAGLSGTPGPSRDPALVPSNEQLWIEPRRATLGVGETTPRFAVMAQAPGGSPREIQAVIESVDPRVLAAVEGSPGRFSALRMGSTQVRAAVGNRTVLADVAVTGARFDVIRTGIASLTDTDFRVHAEITAVGTDGALEYRVFRAGEAPPANWVPSEVVEGQRRVVLESPRIPIGPPSAVYRLTFEARDPVTGVVQQYPFTFRLAPQIERADP